MSQRFDLGDGAVATLSDEWLSLEEADRAFQSILREAPWTQGTIRVFGREVLEPRLSAWVGDADARYTYSGRPLVPAPWTEAIAALRDAVSATAGVPFNSVLLNRYRDGRDAMGFHADDEPELGRDPVIASVSLGAPRRFLLRHRKDKSRALTLTLRHGSLLVMGGSTQHHYRHAIPRTSASGERINLTFRLVREDAR